MKTASIIALCWTIILTPLPYPCFGGENAAVPPPRAPSATEICFPLPDGERILRDLESLPPTRATLEACADMADACEVRATALEGRVVEQGRELKDARKLVEDTRKAGEDAAKVAAGPWYQRALSTVKWVALGIVLGFVGAAGK